MMWVVDIKNSLILIGMTIILGVFVNKQKPVDERPNILLKMVDDMGYSDLGYYGGEVQIANIDKLVSGEVHFAQMHNGARCCPTHASMLTGHYAQDAGIYGMDVNLSMSRPKKLHGLENTVNRGLAHVIDILPTCLSLSGTEYPAVFNGKPTFQLSAKNLLPFLFRETETIHCTLLWEHEGGRAKRINDWKMSALKNHKWELFNIEKDHTETNDLSGVNPGKVEEMKAAWEIWALKTGIKID